MQSKPTFDNSLSPSCAYDLFLPRSVPTSGRGKEAGPGSHYQTNTDNNPNIGTPQNKAKVAKTDSISKNPNPESPPKEDEKSQEQNLEDLFIQIGSDNNQDNSDDNQNNSDDNQNNSDDNQNDSDHEDNKDSDNNSPGGSTLIGQLNQLQGLLRMGAMMSLRKNIFNYSKSFNK